MKLYTIIKNIYFQITPFCFQALFSRLYFKPKFGNNVTISKGRKFYYGEVKFGRGVRIAANSVFSNLDVGNYTVFAEHFRMYVVHHDYTAFSINDILNKRVYKKRKILRNNLHEPNETTEKKTYIGADCWIGEFVTVKPGVKIGDGAIVAGGSIVTHDVEPFSIVGGVPAKFIKWRFDEDTRGFLSKLEWWNWPEEKIINNWERLCAFDRTLLEE